MSVTVENYRFFRHAAQDVVTRLRNLAFMANKKPRMRKDPLQFVLVDLLTSKNIPANSTLFEINQTALLADCSTAIHPNALNLFPFYEAYLVRS